MLTVVLFLLDALAVGVDVGVARHADERAVERAVGPEAAVEAGEDHVLEQDIGEASVGGRHLNHACHRGRDLDETQQTLLVRVPLERAGEVEGPVAQVGEGVARVDDERRDDGGDVGLEVALGEGLLLGGERARVCAVDAVRLEVALDAVEDTAPALDELGHLGHHGVDLLEGRHVGLVVAGLALERREVREPADAHHEELVEVRLEDRDELEALEQRHARVVGLVEHAVVEPQPAELSVLGVGEIVLALGLVRLLLFIRPGCHVVPISYAGG